MGRVHGSHLTALRGGFIVTHAATLLVFGAEPQRAVFVTVKYAGNQTEIASLTDVQERRSKPVILSTNFTAVTADEWPAGLVPVFPVARDGGYFELRRLPARGMENVTDPLFFALPNEDDHDAAVISGTWQCSATNSEGSAHSVTWQLGIDGPRVGGRFDPQTEYRFASIVGGTFRSNQLELVVEHTNDRFLLNGTRRGNTFSGTWHQVEGPQLGGWTARRPTVRNIATTNASVPLYEWTMQGQPARRYLTAGEQAGEGWQRAAHPLCRVWRAH